MENNLERYFKGKKMFKKESVNYRAAGSRLIRFKEKLILNFYLKIKKI